MAITVGGSSSGVASSGTTSRTSSSASVGSITVGTSSVVVSWGVAAALRLLVSELEYFDSALSDWNTLLGHGSLQPFVVFELSQSGTLALINLDLDDWAERRQSGEKEGLSHTLGSVCMLEVGLCGAAGCVR